MEEKTIQPWIAVKGDMDDEYREIVVNLALEHIPQASRELRVFALKSLSRAISVPGFRTFRKVPVKIAQHHVIDEFQNNPLVALVIISLWADASQNIIDDLIVEAEKCGLVFNPEWSWQEACDGYYDFDDIQKFKDFTYEYVENKEKPESDHYILAMLWLSRALGEGPSVTQEEETHEQIIPASAPQQQKNGDLLPVDGEGIHEKTAHIDKDTKIDTHEPEIEAQPGLEGTLEEMGNQLAKRIEQLTQARKATIAASQNLPKAAKEHDIASFKNQLLDIESALTGWEVEILGLGQLLPGFTARLTHEVELRPDIASSVVLIDPKKIPGSLDIKFEKSTKEILASIQNFIDYDRDKLSVLEELNKAQAIVLELNEGIVEWNPDEHGGSWPVLQEDENGSELTLTQIRNQLHENNKKINQLKLQISQYRELSLNHIASLTERLNELGAPQETELEPDLNLRLLPSNYLSDWPSKRLISIEKTLADLIDELLTRIQSEASKTLAAKLYSEWDDDKLLVLLDQLALEKRDLEAFLLLLAANESHPRAESISISRHTVRCLLEGLEQFSKKSHPFMFLNTIGPLFLSGWKAADHESQSELCLLIIAAQSGGNYKFSEDFLWQLPSEWPISQMANWSMLWHSVLFDQTISIQTNAFYDDLEEKLNKAQLSANQMWIQEHGSFTCLSVIRNKPHRSMMNSDILPELFSSFEKLSELEQELSISDQDNISKPLELLEIYVPSELLEKLDEERLFELYEAGVSENEIDDTDTKPRRACLRTLGACAEVTIAYGQALLELWQAKSQSQNIISYETLSGELNHLPDLFTLENAALDHIYHNFGKELPVWDATTADSAAKQQLVTELLSQTTYTTSTLSKLKGTTGTKVAT